MSSSSSSSGTTIAVVIAAAAIFQLSTSGAMDDMVSGFFDNFGIAEQLSLLSLVFAVIFAAVSISHQLDTTTSMSSNKTTTKTVVEIDYPLEDMAKCKTDKAKFECLYPLLRDELLDHMTANEMNEEATDWCCEMMDYTVPGGKLNRGTTVVDVHRTLMQRDLTDIEVARASVLGWAIEFLQAFFLVADDVMDTSQTRRGQPCWYKLPKVALIAINDSFLLESYVFSILKKHFGSEPYYYRLVELFLSVIQKTEFGQLLDLTSQPTDSTKKKVDLTRFTLDRYQKIVKYKTAFYTFYLPVAIGMITSGVVVTDDDEAFELARNICCIMGEYFQVQDDYLDCFGDPKLIGKVGTDIQDNKCSWLVVQALERATPAQRAILEKNYGDWNDAKVKRVKDLYKELDLPAVFAAYEEESYKQIQAELDKVNLMPRDVFELLLNKIYKRSK